jgi:peroxiredoxin
MTSTSLRTSLRSLFICASLFVAGTLGAATVGQPAPAFTLSDLEGKPRSLEEFKGKVVVLEWVNPDCPFVKKHYDKSGNMPALQKAAAADGVVWLLINSGAPGKQGDYDVAQAKAWLAAQKAAATAYLRDTDGKVGNAYKAKSTPHMFVINAAGILVYNGAIDSVRSANAADIEKAENYVKAALAALKAGSEVTNPSNTPYGCSVKY